MSGTAQLFRRLECWLCGHRAPVWRRDDRFDIDAQCYSLRCHHCRRRLHELQYSYTMHARERYAAYGFLVDELERILGLYVRPWWRR